MGEVEIMLGGAKQTLRCSLRAAKTVSALSGGFSAAFRGLSGYDMATYAAIVAAGLDKRSNSDVAKLEQDIYAAGLEPLTKPLVRYLELLMNGGREPEAADEGATGNA